MGATHDAIDAQIAVLRERMSSGEVYDAYGGEDADEFDQHTFDAALNACDWMTGLLAADEDSPARGLGWCRGVRPNVADKRHRHGTP